MFKQFKKKKDTKNQLLRNKIYLSQEKAIDDFTSHNLDIGYFPESLLMELSSYKNHLKTTFKTINKAMFEDPKLDVEFTLKQMLSMMDIILLNKYGPRALELLDKALLNTPNRGNLTIQYEIMEKKVNLAQRLAPACEIAIEFVLERIGRNAKR